MKVNMLGLGAALVLTLAACGDGEEDVASDTTDATTIATRDTATTDTDDTATDDTDDADGRDAARPDGATDLDGHVFDVSLGEALEIARSESGSQENPYKIAIDWEDSAWQWEIDIMSDAQDWEIRIDATTGEIRESESDSEDDPERPLELDTLIAYEEAIDSAVAERPGRVTGWELSWDDGRQSYEVEINDDSEVKVDALNGDVVKVDD